MSIKANIFNIEDFSIDDGPGLRTVVFFKGCSLRCKWCHNPESLTMHEEIMIYDEKCIGCGECFKVCPTGAHRVFDGSEEPDDRRGIAIGQHYIAPGKCVRCMKCVEECFSESLVRAGETVDTEMLKARILRNKGYFKESRGGVTFSGGECMLQIDALEDLLKFCRENGIHTAVDTCGNVPWSSYERVIPYTGLFLYDIKAMDPAVHTACTGVDNRLILENFAELQKRGCKTLVRVPYIPGQNDGELPQIAAFLSKYPEIRAELLGYHTLGISKYKALRLPYIEAYSPTVKEMDELKKQYGFLA